jgi:predicted ATPase/DNA-binding CsgD family transcriptional regulator
MALAGGPEDRLHNLLLQPTPLIGRDQELAIGQQQLLADGARLLTLAGPAGVGKTRLAVAIATAVRENFAHGAWFVDLAPLGDPGLVPSTIARTLGVREAGTLSLPEILAAYFRERHLLLVLDNFEHVLPAASVVADFLATCPGLAVLATSRERLRLRWERVLPVLPLALPDLGRPVEPATAAQVPAVALFVQRARAVAPGFALTAENASAVAALCARLDGLPLALELAAARASVLAPDEILARLEGRLSLPRRGAVDLPARHQTLQAAMDWSYDLLPAEEQALFRRLGVFAGGWTLAAAEAVAVTGGPGLDALDGLAALAEKSLVLATHHADDGSRFGLLETVRDYASERLAMSGELVATRRAHAAYYLSLAEQTEAEVRGPRQQRWFDRLEREHDNLRAALRWASEDGEPQPGARLAAALWPFWWMRGHVAEGRRWLEITLARYDEAPDELRLRALEGLGTLTGWQGEYEQATARLDEALRLARAFGDEYSLARVLSRLAWVAWLNGRYERTAELVTALAACREAADPWSLAYGFLGLGFLLRELGRDDAAVATIEDSLALFRNEGVEERHGAALGLTKLALLTRDRGEVARAARLARQGLEAARALRDPHVTVYCADDVAQLVGERGTPDDVARLLGGIDALREILSWRRAPRERAAHDDLVADLRHRLGEEAFAAAWAAGRGLAPDEVVEAARTCLDSAERSGEAPAEPTAARHATNPLSEREQEVLRLVAEGLTNQQIAERLVITERTARFHVTSIFNKLGADNRAQAVALAAQRGLL